MANVDALKLERDGHLFAGKPDRYRVDRLDLPPPGWLIERDEEGTPMRLHWNGTAVAAWEARQAEKEERKRG